VRKMHYAIGSRVRQKFRRTVVFGTPTASIEGVDDNGIEWWDAEEYNRLVFYSLCFVKNSNSIYARSNARIQTNIVDA